MSAILSLTGLSKRYGSIQAVNNLSIEVQKGQVFGILGPNGSGKTTTLGMLLGVINPDAGHFQWFGESGNSSGGANSRLGSGGTSANLSSSLKRIGAILETPNFLPYLSAVQNLKIVAEIKGVGFAKIDPILAKVGLLERKNSPFNTFSLGMKQRLALASALLNDPEILVLDEPTNGLDPQGIAEVRELILSIADQGTTILIASHLLDEIEKVCTHVAILKKGEKLYSGPVGEISRSGAIRIEVSATNHQALEDALSTFPGIGPVSKQGAVLQTSLADEVKAETIGQFLFDKGIVITHLVVKKSSLEKQFLDLIAQNSN